MFTLTISDSRASATPCCLMATELDGFQEGTDENSVKLPALSRGLGVGLWGRALGPGGKGSLSPS